MIKLNGIGFGFLALAVFFPRIALAVIPGGIFEPGDSMSIRIDDRVWPHTLGYHLVKGAAVYHGRKIPLYTGIFLPPAFFHTSDPMPIVMTLHNKASIGGNGTGSTIGEGLGQLMTSGEADNRAQGDTPDNPISIRKDAQFIGVIPQCPADFTWEDPVMSKALCDLIDIVQKHYHADGDRAYLTGFSFGASSAWRVALNCPDRFAAIICCDGRATLDPVHDVQKLKDLPIYLEVGEWDGDFVVEADTMHRALDTLPHRNYIFHQIPGGNHFNYGSVYTDPNVWRWVFAQHRPHTMATTQSHAVNPSGVSN